ncbi:hypothetical protein BCR32DRAFT_270721 [Anaeromyces robustus]|jgi:predicted secreted protein|uniref:Proteinase inhibitor I42 chagasin domain-containing protein n=1 Tax=Anaeromyces robustus TaxID=1754192 RepID=A0A1Y1WUT9_9FUNG|nr:hypothetical protein BCR32DRAFT_270721 [Anaeromyces robustus]|eukprot:ORX77329.1 hypothetical protein BCR32DRAFT_270721 [Anaeromyces robustus]
MNSKFYISTLAILFLAIVNALRIPIISDLIDKFKSDKSIDVPQKGGEYDLDVAANSSFSINLAGNPTTGYQWYLENESEIQSSSIILVGQNYAQKKNPGKMVGTGGNFVFNFKVNEVCGQVLPDLYFVYKRSWETEEPIATAQITLIGKCEKEQKKMMMEAQGDSVVTAKVNEPFKVELAGNPTTGYNWVLKNREEIDASPLIYQFGDNYNSDEHEEGMVGVGGTFIFEFEVNEDGCGKELPKLSFSYERSWENESAQTAEYTIKLDEDSCKPYISEKPKEEEEDDEPRPKFISEEKNVYVNDNDDFELSFSGNPSTGYTWLLDNEDQLVGGQYIEYVGMEYREKENKDNLDGVGGSYVFTFKAHGICNRNGLLPKLYFVNKREWETESAQELRFIVVPKNCEHN